MYRRPLTICSSRNAVLENHLGFLQPLEERRYKGTRGVRRRKMLEANSLPCFAIGPRLRVMLTYGNTPPNFQHTIALNLNLSWTRRKYPVGLRDTHTIYQSLRLNLPLSSNEVEDLISAKSLGDFVNVRSVWGKRGPIVRKPEKLVRPLESLPQTRVEYLAAGGFHKNSPGQCLDERDIFRFVLNSSHGVGYAITLGRGPNS
ncbi:hypothetical protein EDD16DRAFT_1518255 [Pisolithus croceorrhizus]|nr:hypothetical protein EDD16DRAFT_1518255 [Pisolithus croceorrhizus]